MVCNNCGEAFPDVIDYGYCGSCEEAVCQYCKNELLEKYGEATEEEFTFNYGEGNPQKCDKCVKPTLNKDKFSTLMYALTKHAANVSFVDFLDAWGITEEEYDSIKEYLKENYDVKTYV